jgi:hypothetical protein
MPIKPLSIAETIRQDRQYSPRRSAQWFRTKVQELIGSAQINYRSLLNDKKATLSTDVMPGHMYAFMYDPLTKEKLPYYDKFPLVLPFNMDGYSFIGLNLHYLSYTMRLNLLDKLMAFAVTTKGDGNVQYLRFSWEMIGHVSRLREVQPCVKRYLFSHVRSKFVHIPSIDWPVVTMLPLEGFQKATSSAVWRDSTRKVR